MGHSTLTIKGLSKTYSGSIVALKDVNLEISNGLFGLLGPNGAGKSTLMRTLATLQLPDSGTATLRDVNLIDQPNHARRLIGYLPQELGVYPRILALEMLEYLAGLKGVSRSREKRDVAMHQLKKVNLQEVAKRRLDTFSGGMKQRFGIAAALLGQPKLVIVDEPTAGLDPIERRRFQLMLTEAAKDCVLILSSHIVEDIAGLCSDMALIDKGEILLRGKPDKLCEKLKGKVWQFSTELENFNTCKQQCRLLSWQPHQGRINIRAWAESAEEIPFDNVSPVSATLEDLYAFHIAAEV